MEEGRIKGLLNGKKNATYWLAFKMLIISTV